MEDRCNADGSEDLRLGDAVLAEGLLVAVDAGLAAMERGDGEAPKFEIERFCSMPEGGVPAQPRGHLPVRGVGAEVAEAEEDVVPGHESGGGFGGVERMGRKVRGGFGGEFLPEAPAATREGGGDDGAPKLGWGEEGLGADGEEIGAEVACVVGDGVGQGLERHAGCGADGGKAVSLSFPG